MADVVEVGAPKLPKPPKLGAADVAEDVLDAVATAAAGAAENENNDVAGLTASAAGATVAGAAVGAPNAKGDDALVDAGVGEGAAPNRDAAGLAEASSSSFAAGAPNEKSDGGAAGLSTTGAIGVKVEADPASDGDGTEGAPVARGFPSTFAVGAPKLKLELAAEFAGVDSALALVLGGAGLLRPEKKLGTEEEGGGAGLVAGAACSEAADLSRTILPNEKDAVAGAVVGVCAGACDGPEKSIGAASGLTRVRTHLRRARVLIPKVQKLDFSRLRLRLCHLHLLLVWLFLLLLRLVLFSTQHDTGLPASLTVRPSFLLVLCQPCRTRLRPGPLANGRRGGTACSRGRRKAQTTVEQCRIGR